MAQAWGRIHAVPDGRAWPAQVYLHNALKVAIHVLKNKIISNENDLVGITFVGSVRMSWLCRSAACVLTCRGSQRETKNANDFANVYELHDLQVPSAARIKELQASVQLHERAWAAN